MAQEKEFNLIFLLLLDYADNFAWPGPDKEETDV